MKKQLKAIYDSSGSFTSTENFEVKSEPVFFVNDLSSDHSNQYSKDGNRFSSDNQ